jgi:hypothetical protein
MTTTNNAPISFRLTDDELELLRQYQEDGEKSLNLTAKRLLLNALGVDAKKSSIQVVNTVDTNQIKELIETAVQEKLTELTTVDNVDTVKNLITESLEYGDIKDAIAASYAGMMAQFNGLLEEWQELKKQFEELKSIPPVPVPQPQINEELTIDNEEPTTDNGQLTNEILTEPSKTDSENKSDTQLLPGDELTEIKSDNSPAPIPTKNQTDYVKKKLKKINIEKTAAQIREAFINLGFDGTNYEDLRGEIIEALSNE